MFRATFASVLSQLRGLTVARIIGTSTRFATFVVALGAVASHSGFAQQTTNVVPQTYLGDSFYELYGVNWGFRQMGPNGGVFFNNGGFGGAIPPFGGFDPNAGASFGFGGGGPNGSFFLNFYAGQGSQRSIVSSASTLTLPNGGIGSIYDASARPFVTGVVPVVGSLRLTSPLDERLARYRQGEKPGVRDAAPAAANPAPPSTASDHVKPADHQVAARPMPVVADPAVRLGGGTAQPAPTSDTLRVSSQSNERPNSGRSSAVVAGAEQSPPATANSSATRGDLSVAEIRRRQAAVDGAEAAARREEVASLVEQARVAATEGKPAVAKIFYQQALRRAAPDQRAEIEARLKAVATAK